MAIFEFLADSVKELAKLVHDLAGNWGVISDSGFHGSRGGICRRRIRSSWATRAPRIRPIKCQGRTLRHGPAPGSRSRPGRCDDTIPEVDDAVKGWGGGGIRIPRAGGINWRFRSVSCHPGTSAWFRMSSALISYPAARARSLWNGSWMASTPYRGSAAELRRRALAMTETELKLMAAPAIMGLSSSPSQG